MEPDSPAVEAQRRLVDEADGDAERARAVTRLSLALRNDGRLSEALAAASTAADLFGRAELAGSRALCLRLEGELLASLDQREAAVVRLREAREALEESGAGPEDLASCDRTLADVLRDLDRLEEAAVHLRQAGEAYGAAGREVDGACCTHDAAVIEHHLDPDGRAVIDELAAAREVFMAARLREAVATCDFNLGCVLHDLGHLDDAVEHLQLARSIFEAVERDDEVAGCNQNLGAVLFDMGRLEESAKRLAAARGAFAELGEVTDAAECDANLAVVFEAAGRPADAARYAARAEAAGVGVLGAQGALALELPEAPPPPDPEPEPEGERAAEAAPAAGALVEAVRLIEVDELDGGGSPEEAGPENGGGPE